MAGERIAVTVPAAARVKVRLASLLASMVQEGLGITDILDVAVQALLVGLLALEWARKPEGAPPGITKLIREALNPEVAAPRLILDDSAAKPETPIQRGWRTWKDAYLKAYARGYPIGPACGNAMKNWAKLAVELCASFDHHEDADLELLFNHWWREYLRDAGYSKGAGDPGFLRAHSHGLPYFGKGIQSYGTPWDREVKKVMRPAFAPAPAEPRRLAAKQPGLFDKAEGARGVVAAVKGRAS